MQVDRKHVWTVIMLSASANRENKIPLDELKLHKAQRQLTLSEVQRKHSGHSFVSNISQSILQHNEDMDQK
jgi:hypothetical protein